jgi:hypothetical protein
VQASQITAETFKKMPLAFTKNMGQWDERVLFRANARDATMWFTKDGVTYQFTRRLDKSGAVSAHGVAQPPSAMPGLDSPMRGNDVEPDSVEQLVLTAKFIGANPNPEIIAAGQLEYKCNYFIGNDPAKWHTDVPNYEAITLKDIYPGIDLKYSSDGNGQAAYEFIAAPGADIAQIKVAYDGAEETSLDSDGKTILKTKWGDMTAAIGSSATGMGAASPRFTSDSKNRLGSETDGQNLNQASSGTLTLTYSTYLGGGDSEVGYAIAVDSGGNAYVTGSTASSNFPTLNPYQTFQGGFDVFVTKLSSSGNYPIYSTYFGGGDEEEGWGIAVDGSGYTYVTGWTYSSSFPTMNPYQTYQGSSDVFVSKLSSTGNSLIYSTYFGGGRNDYGWGIAVDSNGYAYVTGMTRSSNFPTLIPFQTYPGDLYYNAFVTKLSSSGNSLIYSTYLGGGNFDIGYGIAVDHSGNAYVTGETYSSNFPTVNPYQAYQGDYDVFVTKLSSSGNSLIYSTYLGGQSVEYGQDIAVDGAGNAYVSGSTNSYNFPILNPYQMFQGSYDAFIIKLSNTGNNLIYSTYLGGGSDDRGNQIAIDGSGSAYVTGQTLSSDFPTKIPFRRTRVAGMPSCPN